MSARHAKKAAAPDNGDAVAPTPANARRGARPVESTQPLHPRLRPVAHALAELLLADLVKYTPKP
jgi:hypothetical protein